MEPLGWVHAKLGDARAIRRYRRRVAAQSASIPVPFDVPFDLPLPGAYIPVRAGSEPDGAAAGQQLRDPATVVAHSRGTLVLGPPGAGKSTFLRHLEWASGPRLTVEVPLTRVERLDDVTGAIVESFERRGVPAAADVVRRELGRPASSLTVLFDGLDEVGSERRAGVARLVADFAAHHPSVKFVVTCRTQADHGALDQVVDQTVHLQPLSDDLVAHFLRAWPGPTSPISPTSPQAADWLVGALQATPWLAPLVRNPLVLTRLAVLHSTTYRGSVGDLVHDRWHLCREMADLLLSRWKPEHNRERWQVKKAVLQHLAADGLGVDADPRGMRYEDVLAEVRVVLPRHDREPGMAAAVLDEIVERSGLLVRLEGGERYRFADRAMQQYFAALELHDRPDEVLRRYRGDRDAWRGVLELSCGGDQDATAVIGGLVDAGDTAAALACLADATRVDRSVGDSVVESAKAALVDGSTDDEVIRSWGRFVSSPRPHGRAGFEYLASRPASPRAAAALALSGLPQAAEVLASWAARDEKVLPHLERLGHLAVPSLAGLAARGSVAAAQAVDRIVNPGSLSSPSGPVLGLGPAPGSPARPGAVGAARRRGGRGAVPVALVALSVLVAVVVVWGRSGDGGAGAGGEAPAGPDEPDPARPEGAMELVWSTPPTHVASEPVLAGGNVVAHVVDGDGLALVAHDPATGTEVWRRPSTASQVPSGIVLFIVSEGDLVFHMSPGQGDSATIEAVDAATGDRVWRTEPAPGGFGDPVDFCSDDSLCVSALVGGTYQRWTIDPATGRPAGSVAGLRRPLRAQPLEGRSLGFGLVDLYPSRDIARVVDGQVVWRRAPRELFGGHDVSPDYGWRWRTTGDLLVGTLGSAVAVPEFGSAEVVPQFTAGIDASTGETRWVAEGDPNCGERLTELDLSVDGTEPWLRCRMTGTLDLEDRVVTGADVDAVMEGFDPVTGEATWTSELEGASGLYVDARRWSASGGPASP